MDKEVILTGLRSNAQFHIGNYLGAILPMVELQKKHSGQYQLNMFIPDLHSFTTPIDHGTLYQQSLQNLKVFVAAGLDIEDPSTFIYRQSYIPAHSEMTWILSCFTYFGELSRMTQFKEKSGQKASDVFKPIEQDDALPQLAAIGQINKTLRAAQQVHNAINQMTGSGAESESVSAGLFLYPVLMAADILLYGANYVPVGDDQRQHLELARDLAMRMNNRFGELLSVPHSWEEQLKFMGLRTGVRIRSLRNPEKKMSKSVDDPAGTIMLSDSPDEAAKKVMSATTDSMGTINFDAINQPGISNLLRILALLGGQNQDEVNRQWIGKNSYGELKQATADAVKTFLTDFQAKLSQVDEAKLINKLESDEAAMSAVANATLLKVQKAVGLRPA